VSNAEGGHSGQKIHNEIFCAEGKQTKRQIGKQLKNDVQQQTKRGGLGGGGFWGVLFGGLVVVGGGLFVLFGGGGGVGGFGLGGGCVFGWLRGYEGLGS